MTPIEITSIDHTLQCSVALKKKPPSEYQRYPEGTFTLGGIQKLCGQNLAILTPLTWTVFIP